MNLDRPLAIDVEAETGAGDDRILSWMKTQELRPGKAVLWDHEFELGEGSDHVDLRVEPGSALDPAGVEVQVTASEEPGDSRKTKVSVAEAGGPHFGDIDLVDVEKLRLETGSGDDAVAINYTLFLEAGEPVRGTVFDLCLATGVGDDTVDFRTEIIDATETARESAAMLNVALDLGPGDDAVRAQVIYSKLRLRAGFPAAEEASLDLLIGVDSPTLEDHIDLYMNIWINQTEIPTAPADSVADVLAGISVGDAAMDDHSSCWVRVGQLHTSGSMAVSLDALTSVLETSTVELKVRGSDAADNVRALIDSFANVSVDVETNGGNDSMWIDLGAPVMSRALLDAGDGDDDVSLHVHDGTSNTILFAEKYGRAGDDRLSLAVEGEFAEIDVTANGGVGNDLVQSNVVAVWVTVGFFEVVDEQGHDTIDFEARVGDASQNLNLNVEAGGGNDLVLINLSLPAVRPVDDARADRIRIDLGEGDNDLDLSIVSTLPPDDGKPAEFRPAAFLLKDGSGSSTIDLLVDGMLTDITADLGDGDNVIEMNFVGAVPGMGVDVRTGLGANLFNLTAHINANDKLELYDYPGSYASRFDGVDGGDTVHINWLDNLQSLEFDLDVRLGQAPPLQLEADDGVLIAFTHGDARAPVVLGMLWNSHDKPPESSEAPAGELRLAVDVGDDALPAVQVNVRGWDVKSKEEIVLEFEGAFADLDVLAVLGDGDDTIDASIVGVPLNVVLNLSTGDGDDRIEVNVSGPNDVVTGAGSGVPHVKAFTGTTSAETQSFIAYDSAFTGGVRVATGDVNGDGVADIITGAGPGAGPHVKVFDGRTNAEIRSFFAYGPTFLGGVFVAAGDVNGDGFADIITGAGPGAGPHVKVFDGRTNAEIRNFFAYGATFAGGVRVAAGDVNGDGFADIITGVGPGAGPHVKVFDGRTTAEIRSFFAYDPSFTGGVFVAAGDVNGDGRDDIVTGPDAGGPAPVKVTSGATGETLRSFFAFDASFRGGVCVAAGDVSGDGFADVVVGSGLGAGPHVKVFDGTSVALLRSFFAFDPAFRGGVFVASGDVDGGKPEPSVFDLTLATGAGDDHAELTFVTGRNRTDSIHADMGTGADSFVLDWQGALQDPAVALKATVDIDPGGSEATIPGDDDMVQVTFVNGDPDRPVRYSWAWMVRRSGEPEDESLQVEIASVEGFLEVSSALAGGSGNDNLSLFFEGKLRVGGNSQSTPPVRALLDMGDGDDEAQIDFSKLSIEGAGNRTPIALDVRGGAGSDALTVTGTSGADKLSLNGSTIFIERVATAVYAGFEFLLVDTFLGDDAVTMTGINPGTQTTIDGGEGRDRFIGRFGPRDIGDLILLHFEQATILGGSVTVGPAALRLERDEEDRLSNVDFL